MYQRHQIVLFHKGDAERAVAAESIAPAHRFARLGLRATPAQEAVLRYARQAQSSGSAKTFVVLDG